MLEKCSDDLTAYLNYSIHAKKNSMYNTPPVFPIYAVKLVLEWIKRNGGVKAMETRNAEKAAYIYDVINNSNGYYTCPVDENFRSKMNIVFRLKSEDLDKKFIAEAAEAGMICLKGHRDVGGCRASVYNSQPMENAKALAQFMEKFAKNN